MIIYPEKQSRCARNFIATYVAQGDQTMSLDGLNYILGVNNKTTELYKTTIHTIRYSWLDCLYYILFHSIYKSDYRRNQDEIPIIAVNVEVLRLVKIYYSSIETEHRYNQIIQLLHFFDNADKNKNVLYFVVSLIHYITKDDIIYILKRLSWDPLFKTIIYSVGKDDVFNQISKLREEGEQQISQSIKQYREECKEDIKLITNHPLYAAWLDGLKNGKRGFLHEIYPNTYPELIKAFMWAAGIDNPLLFSPSKQMKKELDNKLSKIKKELFSHLPEFAAQYIVKNQGTLRASIIEHDELLRYLLIMICRRIVEKEWLQGPMIAHQISAYCLGAYNLDISPSLLSSNRSDNLIASLIEQEESV